jgi:hypothetical protein
MSRDEGAGDLLDAALHDEIELVSDLVVAASAASRHFTPEEVDALLGLTPAVGEIPEGRADEPDDGPADASG